MKPKLCTISLAYMKGTFILLVIPLSHLGKSLFFLKPNHLKAGAQVSVFVFETKFVQNDIIQF